MQRILVLNTLWHPISSGKLNEFKSMQCIQLSKQFTHRQTHTTDDHLCMCNECGGAKSWIFQPSRMPLLLYNDYTYMHVLVLGDGFRFSSHINSIFDPSVTDAMTTHLKALNLSWRNGEVDHSHKLLLWANVQILLSLSPELAYKDIVLFHACSWETLAIFLI